MIDAENLSPEVRELLEYLEARRGEILGMRDAYREWHLVEPNALQVPARFALAALGVRYMGLRLVSAITDDDLRLTEPRVCVAAFGREDTPCEEISDSDQDGRP